MLISRTKEERDVDPLNCSTPCFGKAIASFYSPKAREAYRSDGFKRGVGHLASRHPDIPVIPVYLDGLYPNYRGAP